MDDATKAEYDAQSQQLRADLKSWESDWAKTHKGQKPGREDIKANPEIGRWHGLETPPKTPCADSSMNSSEVQAVQQGPRYPLWQGTTVRERGSQAQETQVRRPPGPDTHKAYQTIRDSF
ncbi:DNA replication regulator sld2 [Ilyonectria robusta]